MHIHILGICGTFMGGLAALAREAGHKVTGCDAGVYPPMSDQLRALGIERPRVAIVAAVETVNPAIPATLDARELVALAREGVFGDALVEGPFGFDNAISAAAAHTKGIVSEVAGKPDLLLVPDLNAGNILYKSMVYLAGAECAGVVLGARVPVILTSRADSPFSRVASCALAKMLALDQTRGLIC